jgi:hypothetical protein
MNSIEEIVYQAYYLDIREELFSKVSELKFISNNRYKELKDIYEEAFNLLVSELREV